MMEDRPKNTELARIQGYIDKETEYRTLRYDGYARSNDHAADYYDLVKNPEHARTKACVAVEWSAFNEIAQDANMIYVPCGISSGLRAHEELDLKNRSIAASGGERGTTTYHLDEVIGATIHRDRVMEPNKTNNLQRARIIGRTHPDNMIIAPVVREGAVREISRTGAFSRWQRYEEEDFMAFWYPLIDKCKGMCLDGDWNFSRNSIWEMMRGVLMQAGQIPSRPHSDMEVFDLEGKPVTLLARAEKVAEMLKYQLGKGFDPREAATALAQIFTIDDDIRSGKIPDDHLHPILKHRPAAELRAMDTLKTELKPILLNHCASIMRLDDLPEEYRQAARLDAQPLAPEQQAAFMNFADDISERQFKVLSVEPSDALKAKLAKAPPSAQRLFDSYERFFEKGSHAKLFEDDLYSKLSEWERVALPFAIGATEIGLYPTAHPMATMICTDLKRGEEGFRRAQEAGVSDMSELAGALGEAIEEVKSINAQKAEALKAKLKAENPRQVVVNTPSFLRIADTIEHFRKVNEPGRFVAAPGASETSPNMRLALQMKFLDRNVDRAIFQEGWEHSNDLVQLRVRARLLQAGLIERPAGEQSKLHVFTEPNLVVPDTLLHDITLLTKEVKRAVDANVRAPEQALALARLVTLHELLVDPTLQRTEHKVTRELINTLKADESLTCYNRAEAKTITEEAKEIITSKAALWIPRERLYVPPNAADDPDATAAKMVQNRRMEDYIKAQERLLGEQGELKQRPSQDEIVIKKTGARR